MTIEIRAAGRDDVSEMRAVAREAWHAAHVPIAGEEAVAAFLEEFYDVETFRSKVDDDAALLVVADDSEGGVVGFALASPTGDGDADDGEAGDGDAGDGESVFGLSRIYVSPERWGEGIGRRLLDRVERSVRDCGGTKLTLGVVADNERAVGFYESAGYDRVDSFHDDRLDVRGYTYEKSL